MTHVTVPPGFAIELIAHVRGARELAFTPNGDLLIGTLGRDVAIVADAEHNAQPPQKFVRLGDAAGRPASRSSGESALRRHPFRRMEDLLSSR